MGTSLSDSNAMTPVEIRAVFSLSLLYAFRMLGLFMVLPVLALYASDYEGATPALVGLALGAYGLTQACLQIPAGLLSDRWGRKPVILLGLALFGLGSVVAAGADHVWELILGRALQGVGAIASALMALLTDVTRDQQRSKAMASLGASIGLSFVLAMVLGPWLAARSGLSLVFHVTAGLAVVGAVIVLWLVPTPTRRGRAGAVPVPAMLGQCLRDRPLWQLNAGVFTLHFAMTAAFTVVPLLLEQAGLARTMHWQVYLPVLFGSFLLMLPVMIRAERGGWLRGALRGMGLTLAGGVGLMALAGGASSGLILALLVFFFAFNWLEATLPALLSRQVDPAARGTAMGLYTTSQFLGVFAGGTAAGYAAQLLGGLAGLWLAALVIGLWLCWMWSFSPPELPRSLVVNGPSKPEAATELMERISRLQGVEEVTRIGNSGQLFLRVNDEFDRLELARIDPGLAAGEAGARPG